MNEATPEPIALVATIQDKNLGRETGELFIAHVAYLFAGMQSDKWRLIQGVGLFPLAAHGLFNSGTVQFNKDFIRRKTLSKWRKAPAVDANQPGIVKALRKYGCTVQTGMDDILVGYKGVNYWIEIKTEDKRRKDGKWKAGALKPSQIALTENWRGQYHVCCTIEEIIELMETREEQKSPPGNSEISQGLP